MRNRHLWQLKKPKSWGPFWRYQLNKTANSAYSPQKLAKWPELGVLFSLNSDLTAFLPLQFFVLIQTGQIKYASKEKFVKFVPFKISILQNNSIKKKFECSNMIIERLKQILDFFITLLLVKKSVNVIEIFR